MTSVFSFSPTSNGGAIEGEERKNSVLAYYSQPGGFYETSGPEATDSLVWAVTTPKFRKKKSVNVMLGKAIPDHLVTTDASRSAPPPIPPENLFMPPSQTPALDGFCGDLIDLCVYADVREAGQQSVDKEQRRRRTSAALKRRQDYWQVPRRGGHPKSRKKAKYFGKGRAQGVDCDA